MWILFIKVISSSVFFMKMNLRIPVVPCLGTEDIDRTNIVPTNTLKQYTNER